MTPFRLEPKFVERVWGNSDLSPFYAGRDLKIGEVWHQPSSLTTAPPWGHHAAAHQDSCCSILVKFLFTTERLSVQVHPDDPFARKHENSAGKTEMWHILEAQPGASIAVGFRKPLSAEDMRAAALDGSIEGLLEWREVHPGDTYFLAPGTVHAIGAGIKLCEIQQDSDVTYRLYDYGRARELHLDKGILNSKLESYEQPMFPSHSRLGRPLLASCNHFTVDWISIDSGEEFESEPHRFHLLIAVSGAGSIGGERFQAGEVWFIPAGADNFKLTPDGPSCLLRAFHT